MLKGYAKKIKIEFQCWKLKAIWIYLHTFIPGIIFKLSGQRCQRQVCLNMESPWQNNPSKFPCGRKQTRRLSMRDHLFTHREVTRQCLCEPWSPSVLYIHFWGRNRLIWSTSPSPTPFVSALLGSLVTAEWSPHYWEELACNFTTHFLSMLSNNKWRPSLCTKPNHVLLRDYLNKRVMLGDKLSQE